MALLVFLLLLTYLATRFVSVYWAPFNCERDPARQWLLASTALVPAALRRRLPTVSLFAAAALFGWYPAIAAVFALTAYTAVARIRPGRRLALTGAVAAAIPVVVALIGSGLQWKSVLTAFGLGIVACIVVPGMLAILLAQRERLLTALRQQTRYLQRNCELADSAARMQERSRIADEMHDTLGHRLSLISLYAGALELDAERSTGPTDEVRLIRGTVADAMDDLRRLLGILREGRREGSSVQPADLAGSKADLGQLIAQSQAAGIPVHMAWAGDDMDDVAPTTRRAIHRIVREALTNVHRHAHGASATVLVNRGTEHVRVEIANGVGRRGAHPSGVGSGLVGVQERVRLLGGNFRAKPTAEGGFVIAADLPVHPREFGGSVAAASATPSTAERPAGPPLHRRASGWGADWWARTAMMAVLSTGLASTFAIVNVTFNYVELEPPLVDERFTPGPGVQVGMTQSQAIERVGEEGDPFIALAARTKEPTRPPGAQCMYLDYGPPAEPDRRPAKRPTEKNWPVMRFCFKEDKVVDVARFDLPVVVS